MASISLVESAKLSQDLLIAGVIENIITVNRMFELLPFMSIEGNAVAYNRENTEAAVEVLGVGDTITTGKNPADFTQVTSTLTTILGDAEVNGLIQATRSNINNQRAVQIAAKAKAVGRRYQDMLINGTGAGNEFDGLLLLCAQTVPAVGANGDPLSFSVMDQLMDLVTDKDGEVDYFVMHSRTIRAYFALLRALGGASIGDVVTLPSGTQVPAYRSVPILRNDYIPIDQTQGAAVDATTIFAGTLDDGSGLHGLSGLTSANDGGIVVEDVGVAEARDETITRVKWYSGLALFSEKGLACATGIVP